jgi:hypothetical protein
MFDPQKAREIILRAVENCDGNLTAAAAELKTPHRTLARFVAELGLHRDLELLRDKIAREHPEKVEANRALWGRNRK